MNYMCSVLEGQSKQHARRADTALLIAFILMLAADLVPHRGVAAILSFFSFVTMIFCGVSHGRSARYHELARSFNISVGDHP